MVAVPCAYAVTASRAYFVGLTVMLHSLFHHNARTADCGVLLILWHPALPDTMLLPEQSAALACLAAGQLPGHTTMASDQRTVRAAARHGSRSEPGYAAYDFHLQATAAMARGRRCSPGVLANRARP